MHRGYEKLTEFRTYPQITTLINRIDWLSSFANEVPFIDARRAAHGHRGAAARAVHPHDPHRAVSRIATFVLFLGEMGLQVGALTPAFYGFRDREHVLNLIEGATGGRFHPNFNRIGGLKDDLPWGWITETRTVDEDDLRRVRHLRGPRRRQRDLRGPHPVASASSRPSSAPRTACRARTCGRRASTGTSAATASRTSSYPELDFKVWTHPDGDSFARYWVRLQETRESARMVLQMLDQLPSGPDHGQGAAHHQGARGRGLGRDREPARPDGLLRRLEGRDRPVPGEDPLGVVQQRLDPAVAARGACTSPTSSRSSASLYFILGDIDR